MITRTAANRELPQKEATNDKNGSVLKSSSPLGHDRGLKSSSLPALQSSSDQVIKCSSLPVTPVPHAELRALGERCACSKKGAERRARFELARAVQGLEQCLGRELSFNEQVAAFNGWYKKGGEFMKGKYDKQLALFLRERASVKKPRGGDIAFRRMVKTVAELPASELPVISGFEGDAPETWRRVAALHREKARQAKGGVYQLSCRDTANALEGWDHREAYALNDALAKAGVIEKVENGAVGKRKGVAARWRYLLPLYHQADAGIEI